MSALVAGLGCSAPIRDDGSPIDQSVRKAVDDGVIAGTSVAISRGGEPFLIAGYGLASLEDSAPVTPETIFNVGSVTKLFTAAAMLTLVDTGTVHLDDPVERWLPTFAAHAAGRVTIRQLLNHTSGLPEYGHADLERWMATNEPLTSDFVLAYLRDRALDHPPTSHWTYSNSGFYLAGLVIEAASGSSWFEYLSAAVLEPLKLNVHLCDNVADRRARGYERVASELVETAVYVEAGVRGDGGLCTTPSDLIRFVEALEREKLLPRDLLQEMWSPTQIRSGAVIDYGLGVRLGDLGGHRLWGHTGGHAGIIAVVARYPDDDLTIAVLSNTVRSDVDALVLEGNFAAALLEVSTAAPPTVRISDLTPFAGTYSGGATEPTRRIDVEADHLTVTSSNGISALHPLGDNVFIRSPEPYPLDRYVFHLSDGQAMGLSAYYNGFHGGFFRRDQP